MLSSSANVIPKFSLACGQLLITRDNWRIQKVSYNQDVGHIVLLLDLHCGATVLLNVSVPVGSSKDDTDDLNWTWWK